MRLESLTINKFRHVKPCTLEFADDLSVVLGKNGAGKTTLLKLIAAVCTLDFSEFKEELSVDAVLRFAEWQIQVVLGQTKMEAAQWSFPNLESQSIATSVRVTLTTDATAPFIVTLGSSESGKLHGETPVNAAQTLFLQVFEALFKLFKSTRSAAVPNTVFDLLANWANLKTELQRFDESLGFFDWVTTDAMAFFSEGNENHHLIPDGLLATWRKSPKPPGATVKVATEKDCVVLERWAALMSWTALSADIHLHSEQNNITTYAGIRFFASTPARKDRHQNFSYGQKRFLSFLYYAACQKHLLLVDELANGLHHEWIEICFAEMKGKQTIMSSQNPLIFDHLEFNDAAAVSKALILCSQNEQGEMVWENMHAESAAHFFTSYERGIRQVSEILREQKLW